MHVSVCMFSSLGLLISDKSYVQTSFPARQVGNERTSLIHLCPGVNERLWYSILTKVLFTETLTGAELSICQGHVWKAPQNGNVAWFSTYAPIHKRQGVLAGSALKFMAFWG